MIIQGALPVKTNNDAQPGLPVPEGARPGICRASMPAVQWP